VHRTVRCSRSLGFVADAFAIRLGGNPEGSSPEGPSAARKSGLKLGKRLRALRQATRAFLQVDCRSLCTTNGAFATTALSHL
jgi:hypothetical protein